jgi:predicted membrane-bound spermidine synthase
LKSAIGYTKDLLAVSLPTDIRDQVIRFSHYAEALREAGVLLAVFGPVSVAEIFRAISLPSTLVIWAASAIILLMGVEWNVRLERQKRKLAARGLI